MFDVAIIGFGPTGAVTAGLLGLQGIRTFVCDELTEVYDKPRAIALDHEIMRVFQQLGIAKALEPFTEPFTNSEFYGVDGQLIKCMSTVAPPYPLAFSPSLVFTQPAMETLLRERVGRMPSVQVELGCKVTALQQSDASVTLTVADAQGQTREVSARYLIACDGASSFARKQVGIALQDLGFDEPWLVVDVLVNDKGLAKLPKVSVQYCEPQRPCTYVIGPKNHRRWEIALNPGEDPKPWPRPKPPGSSCLVGCSPTRPHCGGRRVTSSTPWWPKSGASSACSWRATPRTSSRHFWARACARASAMRPT